MGTSVKSDDIICYDEDHPHAYGDKINFPWVKNTAVGSSPRVWGQVILIP